VTEREQICHFATELDALVDRFSSEYDLMVVSVIGVLALKQKQLCDEAEEGDDPDPPEAD
jgi:hypothetical protein